MKDNQKTNPNKALITRSMKETSDKDRKRANNICKTSQMMAPLFKDKVEKRSKDKGIILMKGSSLTEIEKI